MEQAVQENRSITKRESTIRLCAAVFLAILLLILLGFRSVSPQAAKDRVFRIAFCKYKVPELLVSLAYFVILWDNEALD